MKQLLLLCLVVCSCFAQAQTLTNASAPKQNTPEEVHLVPMQSREQMPETAKVITKTPNGLAEVTYTMPLGKMISEQMLIKPASTRWGKGKRSRDCCFTEDPDRCANWILVEVPAQYKTVLHWQLVKPLTWTETPLWLPNVAQGTEPFDFTLSPNPAEAQLHLQTNRNNYQAAKLYITNVAGAVVYEQAISQRESDFWVDVAHFPAGIYAIWFVDAQQQVLKNTDNKFVKK
jgi:hypothetical protein